MNLSWIVGGNEYSLNDRNNYYMLSYSGLGVPDFHRITVRGALQHGTTDVGYRLDDRVIILTVGVKGNSAQDLHNKLLVFHKIFRPRETAGILKWVDDNGIRYVDCHLAKLDDGNRESDYQEMGLVLIANSPTWYDPAIVSSTFSVGGGGDLLEVPTVIPMLVGTSTLDVGKSIIYTGTSETFPKITVVGPIQNLYIEHEGTGMKLDFTGYTIGAGESLFIDLTYGQKTVVDGTGASVLDKLSYDSDLAEFSLLPSPDIPAGVNTILVQGNGVDAGTEITIKYYKRYIGV